MSDNAKNPADATPTRILKGVWALSLGVGINLVARIAYPPLFLRAWGVELYGEWLVLSSAVLYLLLSDFGGQLFITNRLNELHAKGDRAGFEKWLHTGMAMFIVVPITVLLLFLAIVAFFPWWSAVSVVRTPHLVVFWVLAALAFQVCASLPLGIVMGVYRAVGMLPRSAMLNNLNQILQLVLISAGLLAGTRMVGIAFLHMLPVIVVVIIALRGLNRLHPELNVLSLKSADRRLVRQFIRPSGHFFSIQISQALTVQSVLLIVGAMLNSAHVVLYSTLRTVVNSIRQVLAILVNSVWPEMTRFYAREEPQKLVVLFRVVLRITLAAAVVFIILFHYFGTEIFRLWLGRDVGYEQILMDLFLVYVFQLVIWTSCSNVLMSINRHHEISILLLVSSLLTVIFVYAGGKTYGLGGVIAGLIVADVVLPLWAVPALLIRYVPGFSYRFFILELAPVCATLALVLLTLWSVPIVIIGLFIWVVRGLPEHSAFQHLRFLRS